MYSEKELLLDIKHEFDWPVDLERYHLDATNGRYWDGRSFFNELPEHLKRRVEHSRQRIEYAKKNLHFLTKLPWVRMILLTGSVASLNSKEHDDIDVWLVVEEKRLWLTRAFDFLYYTARGMRRLDIHGFIDEKKVDNKFCFNLYSTVKGASFEHHTESYAIQLVDAVPIYEKRAGEYQRMLSANDWVQHYLPSWFNYESKQNVKRELDVKRVPIISSLLDILEYIAGYLMFIKMHKKLPESKTAIFVERFTTWGTDRILSAYEKTQS